MSGFDERAGRRADVTTRAARALEALRDAVERLADDDELAALRAVLAPAEARGIFRPLEEERLQAFFGRLLTVRAALWELLAEVEETVGDDGADLEDPVERRLFVVGYSAACLIVRLDRLLVEEVATHPVTQRKLNEGSQGHRIPRKQLTAVFESLTDPAKALRMDQAMSLAERRRTELEGLAGDADVGALVADLERLEAPLDRSRRRYLELLLRYAEHAVRRGFASATQQATFAVMESGGRLVAELHDRARPKRVTPEVRERLRALLRPGDVIVTRHDVAASNLFLPGYWPHVALYVGTADDRDALGVELEPAIAARWTGARCVLEALKDGVRFRPLEETLAVDACAVVRPRLARRDLARALARVAVHEGKLYNFDFDFFRADRLVCTEVVYRAFDGVGGLAIELRERAGRPTLAAEDLLDLALDGGPFEPVAIYGAPGCNDVLVSAPDVATMLAASYRS